MRYIFVIFCMLVVLASANEIEKIESIVHDISILKQELKVCKLKLKEQEQLNKELKNRKCKIIQKTIRVSEKNRFPNLEMKHKKQHFKARSFRLKEESNIYDFIEGEKLFRWEKNTSFTSHTKSDGWIKVSGYFVNKIWKKAQKELWIEESNTMIRK